MCTNVNKKKLYIVLTFFFNLQVHVTETRKLKPTISIHIENYLQFYVKPSWTNPNVLKPQNRNNTNNKSNSNHDFHNKAFCFAVWILCDVTRQFDSFEGKYKQKAKSKKYHFAEETWSTHNLLFSTCFRTQSFHSCRTNFHFNLSRFILRPIRSKRRRSNAFQ